MQFSKIIILFLLVFGSSCKNDQTVPNPEPVVGEATSSEMPQSKVPNISAAIEAASTFVDWSCSKPGRTHYGQIQARNGNALINRNKLVGGAVTLDMNSITVGDLKADAKRKLESHLKGLDDEKADDFFNVKKYPESKFVITRVVQLNNDSNFNSLIYGNLSIRNIFKEIAFKAKVNVDGSTVTMQSDEFSINRLDWGIIYHSKSLFKALKDEVIDDEVKLKITMKANLSL